MSRTKKIALLAAAAAGVIVGTIAAFVRANRKDEIEIDVTLELEAPDFVEKNDDLG